MLVQPERAAEAAVIELNVDELADHPDVLTDLFAARARALIIRGVYPSQLLQEVIERLRRGMDEVPVFRPHTIHSGAVYGWPLVACGDEVLDQYLAYAEQFDGTCRRLFGEALRPARRVAEVMSRVAGGRPVTLPRAADGRAYCASTIRFLNDGDSLPCHYENESFHAPALRTLAAGLDHSTLMSFYVSLGQAAGGGELRLYHVDCFEGREGMIGFLGGDEQARPHLEKAGYTVLNPAVGDLLLFDGGRFYHEVTTVRGERWTMGGVFAFTHDGRTVHFWG
jgi:hypothetical protein